MAWNGSNGNEVERRGGGGQRNVRSSTSRFNYKALVAGIIVALGGGMAAYMMFRPAGRDALVASETSKPSKIAEVKPQIMTNTVVQAIAPTNRNVRMERGVEVVSVVARTNQSGVVIEKLTLADGRKIKKVVPPKPIFDNASDQMIALALSAKPGESMAPLPSLGNIDEDFAKSLLTPIRINEGDSDKVKELKLSVKEARAYLAAEVKNGRTVAECLREHRERMEDISDRHTMAIQEMQKMRQEGASAEEIGKFRARINEIFREKGIPELPIGNKKTHRDNTKDNQ